MKETFILFLKGFAMGISNLIPGVSGGTVAIILGIYEKFIFVLGHLFKDIKKNITFLIPLLIGMITALVFLSGVITYCLTNYLFFTVMTFCGAIAGGIPLILKKLKGFQFSIKNGICFLASFIIVFLPLIFSSETETDFSSITLFLFLKLFLIGMLASATMVIPGVSGSAVLMALGYYYPIMDSLHSLSSPLDFISGIAVIIPYGLGIIAGLFASARGIELCIKKYPENSLYAIIGFIVSSIIVILLQNNILYEISQISGIGIIVGMGLMLLGYFTALKLSD